MKKLTYGQIGGTLHAFIGDVHRKAIAIDGMATIAAGCFSSSHADANRECGEYYGLASDRIYADYKEMADKESKRKEDRLDFIVISTPNDTHYDIAKLFMEHGFNIACEKPLCFTSEQAAELEKIARDKGLLTCVTYTYTGYNMVKQAKQMIAEGMIGDIIDIKGEYIQDWLMDMVADKTIGAINHSVWRTDPKLSGSSCCVGDIGTHIEETVHYITGLKVKKIAAVLDRFGHTLDLNANMLVEFDNGAHGTFCSSQIAAGHYNGFVIRIFGTKGAIEWEQEHPDFLRFTEKGKPTQILTRSHTWGRAAEINRIPAGHPEGWTMAFANLYKAFTTDILEKSKEGDYPTLSDGLRGVKFIEACVESDKQGGSWVEIK